ncbi:hypothetical protein OSC18_26145 [Serratia nevei]|uniref:hypothetical protein n=1 Tax=Serratia nevei TaxID=2703794 RepID=UPI00285697E2|nr:hypothetical protein [Serratia nevei]MDR8492968.1 hypothetical protein [Serratia nevei]
MSYVADIKARNEEAKLGREETSSSSRKPSNKGLLAFIMASATINDDFEQRGRIHGA